MDSEFRNDLLEGIDWPDIFPFLHAGGIAERAPGKVWITTGQHKPSKPEGKPDGDLGRLWCGSHCGGTMRV